MIKTLKIVWLTTFALLGSLLIQAQQKYQTNKGTIELIGSYRDSIVIASSDDLSVLINYETAEIGLSLDPTTLGTETDSLNVTLINSSLKPIILKGKLNINSINTLQHPDQKLNFTARLQINKIVKIIYADGELKHAAGTETFSSLLTLHFKLRLSDFGIVLPEGWNDEITIQIYQALLKKQ